jgi:hypothetical protein
MGFVHFIRPVARVEDGNSRSEVKLGFMNEYSVLDYLKGLLMPWKYPRISLPPEMPGVSTTSDNGGHSPVEMPEDVDVQPDPGNEIPGITGHRASAASVISISLPWAALTALILALAAQISLEPRQDRAWLPGVIVYLMAMSALGFAIYRGEITLAPLPLTQPLNQTSKIRYPELLSGIILALLTFITASGNRFTLINLILLVLAVGMVLRAFWVPSGERLPWYRKFLAFLSQKRWTLRITPSALLVGAIILLILTFRFFRLDSIPAEMNSDHAEKILDVMRVQHGETMIFFPTNGGREGLQIYLAATLDRFFGINPDFFTLKLSSALIGVFSLLFIYFLGNEIAGPRVGIIAVAFAGVAYWPNVVSRMGLRLPFYILFTAATLYFLIRGLKNNRTNDFLLCGLSLGLSFYGYTANRILPFLILAIIGLFLLKRTSAPYRRSTILATLGLFLVALVLFMPMLRYMVDYPDAFLFRSLSRIGSLERPLPGPAWLIFIQNLGRALVMPSWSNGEVWTLSIPFRPALDVITAALYWLGMGLVFARALREKHWIDFTLLISIPILMLPSVMSLAFPSENPNLYRTGGALVPVFIIIALTVDALWTSLETKVRGISGKLLAYSVVIALFVLSCLLSYDLVFRQYDQQYRLSSWNSSEMGDVIRGFSETIGTPDTAWVIGYPYWVDTRIVGMMSGQPTRDLAISIDRLGETKNDPRAKLFILKPEDEAALGVLENLYPQGVSNTYPSKVPSKEFIIFFVPPIS